jgi:hypothetical protein
MQTTGFNGFLRLNGPYEEDDLADLLRTLSERKAHGRWSISQKHNTIYLKGSASVVLELKSEKALNYFFTVIGDYAASLRN